MTSYKEARMQVFALAAELAAVIKAAKPEDRARLHATATDDLFDALQADTTDMGLRDALIEVARRDWSGHSVRVERVPGPTLRLVEGDK